MNVLLFTVLMVGTLHGALCRPSASDKMVCTPNSTFKIACNTCFCTPDGLRAGCTKIGCDARKIFDSIKNSLPTNVPSIEIYKGDVKLQPMESELEYQQDQEAQQWEDARQQELHRQQSYVERQQQLLQQQHLQKQDEQYFKKHENNGRKNSVKTVYPQ